MGSRIAAVFALALVTALTWAVAASLPAHAKYASIVIDARTGEVLHELNADKRHYPASLTKVMTLYLVFEALKQKRLTLDSKIEVSARAASQPPSRLGFQPGESLTVHDAVLALIVRSANDVAAAVAEHLGDTERGFARLMNQRAQALGMTDTTFRNASGLPHRQQLTTARDLARLVQALRTEFPDYYGLFATRTFTWRGQTYSTHNRLLDAYQGTDGVKTGYIRASGFNLATSANRSGVRLIAVVMGANSPRVRDLHMMGLLERGFEQATEGRYIAYDYDRNIRVAAGMLPVRAAPTVKPQRAKGARGRMELARLTPPRRPVELAAASGEGSSPDPEIPAMPEAPALDWEIQVGAFSRYIPARLSAAQAMRRLPSLLAHARVKVVPPTWDGSEPHYRARLAGLDEERATRACELLRAKDIACLTVSPAAATSATPAR